MNTHDGTTMETIVALTATHADRSGGGSKAAGAIIECIVGAATPMIGGMFSGGTLQERLLFTLILAGACSTMKDEGGSYGLRIDVCPESLREAFVKFTSLTGSDIRPHLPPPMVKFASQASLH